MFSVSSRRAASRFIIAVREARGTPRTIRSELRRTIMSHHDAGSVDSNHTPTSSSNCSTPTKSPASGASSLSNPTMGRQVTLSTQERIPTAADGGSGATSTSFRDNASVVLPVSVHPHSSEHQRNQQIRTVISSLCPHLLPGTAAQGDPGSHDQESDALLITPLLGGLSNELFVVQSRSRLGDNNEPAVLLRIHPKGVGIVDRDAENRLSAWLSMQTTSLHPGGRSLRAPIFYGRFENGRVEEFYPNHVPLAYHDMQQYGPEAAQLLASLHSMEPPHQVLSPADSERDDVWTVMNCWHDRAHRLSSTTAGRERQESHLDDDSIKRIEELLSTLRNEVFWLKSTLDSHDRSSAAARFGLTRVLTHMDAQPLNLLLNLDECPEPSDRDEGLDPASSQAPRLKLIDYEYAGFNARVIDLGNTWCEYMDMNPSTTRDLSMEWECAYPTTEQQDEFLRAYLEESMLSGVDCVAEDDVCFLNELRQLVNKHSLISHLLWATWSCVQRHLSPIEFDYLQYAENRLQTYRHFRPLFFPDSAPTSERV